MVRLGRRPADYHADGADPIQTIYEPGSFTPLIRVETATEELDALRRHRMLAWCSRRR
ncbi:RHS family protein [Salmonella enterica subsp. salamae]|nr:RHS family protein [Salmonella enterica subsp. salamae]